MLNVYVNTWGNYNENGADGGQWITLPMDESELESTLETIAENMKDHDPEWFINDYESVCDFNFDVNENDNILALNAYCQEIDDLSEHERLVYAAACDVFGADCVDITDLNDYNLYTDIESDYDLGYYWAVESGCYDLDKMGSLANYIDYESFGRDIRYESDGGFSEYGWIERC